MPAAFSLRAWFPLSPGVVLLVLLGLSALAVFLDRASRRRRKRALRQLANQWQMTYSASDRLRVATKLIGKLPVPGAADVYVTDVIYGGEGEIYRYLFTAEYTTGAVRGKRRQVRVGTFTEPRSSKGASAPGAITFAPEDLGLVEQYVKIGPPSAKVTSDSGT